MALDSASLRKHIEKTWLFYTFIIMEIIMIIFYSQFTQFSSTNGMNTGWSDATAQTHVTQTYPFLADINVMIFIGFGFLLTVVRGFGWSAVGLNFLLAAWTIQWAVLCNGFWQASFTSTWGNRITLNIHNFIEADYTAWSVIIALGAVYGRINFVQSLVMASFHTFFFAISWKITNLVFKANDIGGSLNVHAFGALYGLTVSAIAGRKEAKKTTTYNTNLLAIIGTLFLWVYFPSFNAGSLSGNAQLRGIVNTVLALTGSCVMTVLFSTFIKDGKLHMEYMLNATLAGGVIVASSANIILMPWISFFLGCFAGIVSVLGYEYIVPIFNQKLKIQDTAGVLSVHGIIGILGGFVAVSIAGTADVGKYGISLYDLFPAFSYGRTNSVQGGYQFATICMVVGISIVSGIFVGILLILPCFTKVQTPFDDEEFWISDEDLVSEYKKTDIPNQGLDLGVSQVAN